MIYTSEKTLEELADKVDSEKKSKIEDLVKELRELISGEDIEAIKTKTDELTKVVQEIGAAIYQEAQQAQQAQAQQESQSGSEGPNDEKKDDDETIDADYEVKK
jgi:molecular chaperone DnaK